VHALRSSRATEAAFREHAPSHRFLHVATHGFFASAKPAAATVDGESAVSLGDAPTRRLLHPGWQSGLVLAGANQPADLSGDDGVLSALEIAEIDLTGVELAVLSACETGIGESARGEGLIGLQRAFQVAGTRSVVASLWKVDDTATREMMERFYDNLWTKQLSRAESLRQAQLWMLNERGSRGLEAAEGPPGDDQRRLPPYFWAAFVLSGEWR
jgi:CHAT domain-containing protein